MHTSGPWKLEEHPTRRIVQLEGGRREPIAYMFSCNLADAKLICHAPKLFEFARFLSTISVDQESSIVDEIDNIIRDIDPNWP